MEGKSFRTYFGLFVLVIGIILIGFNYWHAMTCVKSYNYNVNDMIPILQQRVLEAESQVLQNDLFLKYLIRTVQQELTEKDKHEMEKLVQYSRDEAVKVALDLTKISLPIVKNYQFNEKYKNIDSLANLIDERFLIEASRTEPPYKSSSSSLDYDNYQNLRFREGYDDDKFEKDDWKKGDMREEREVEEEEEVEEFETETERIEACQGWKSHYKVIEGVSWGDLPYDLQKKWKSYNCDVFLGLTFSASK